MLDQKRVFCILIAVVAILYVGYIFSVNMDSFLLPQLITASSPTGEFAQSMSGISISATDRLQKQKFRPQESPHSQHYITEEEAMKDGPLTDVRKTVDVTKSTATLKDLNRTYHTGKMIEIPIILRDGYGQKRSQGGDKLRVRMYNTTLKAFIAGRVLDHNNGSYTATVPALWPGINKISIFLAYARETVQAIYHIRQKMGTIVIGAVYAKGRNKERTSCHAERRWLTQYPDVCNFTLDNGGMSWYCGKPKSKLVTCSDWSFTEYVKPYPELPLTEAEKLVMKPKWELFPDIQVEVKGTVSEQHHLPPCYSYPRQLLWNETKSTGFFYNNKWRLLHCKQPKASAYKSCLQDKRLVISGDSTTRQWYSFLMKDMQCQQVSEKWTTKKWHSKSKCINSSLNFTLEWLPHAQPFFVFSWDPHKHGLNCIAKDIDEIGDDKNVIFVIHMYIHLTAFHHSIFHDRMRHISNSVRNLIKRNNGVIFMIKGPHTYKTQDDRGNRHDDYLGYIYKDIMYKEFTGLHDRVVFMDQSDMSTAKALEDFHPPDDVVEEAVHQMFDYICKDF